MLPTKIYKIIITANQTYALQVKGQYFKIISSTGKVSVQSEFGKLDDLMTGQGLERTPFEYLILQDTSGAVNAIQILIGDENFIDAFTGNMNIIANIAPQSGSFSNLQKTVTSASTQILAANSAREYLLIQNNDAAGIIYVSFGVAATALNGVKVSPGGSYELPGTISTQAIFAIGSIASNANIVTVEG